MVKPLGLRNQYKGAGSFASSKRTADQYQGRDTQKRVSASPKEVALLSAMGGGFRGEGAGNFQGMYSSGQPGARGFNPQAVAGQAAADAAGVNATVRGGFNPGGQIMSNIQGMMSGGGSPGRINTVNTLTPWQQAILSSGGSQVSSLLGSGVLNPMTPQGTEDFYNQYFRPGAEERFQSEVMPQIAESFVGPGTYWGGARAGAEADATQNFENTQLANIGGMYQQGLNRGMGFLPFGLGLAGLNTGVTYGTPGQYGGGGGMNDIIQQLLDQLMQGQGGGAAAPGAQAPAPGQGFGPTLTSTMGGGATPFMGQMPLADPFGDLYGSSGGPGFNLFGSGGGLGDVNYEDFLGTV